MKRQDENDDVSFSALRKSLYKLLDTITLLEEQQTYKLQENLNAYLKMSKLQRMRISKLGQENEELKNKLKKYEEENGDTLEEPASTSETGKSDGETAKDVL